MRSSAPSPPTEAELSTANDPVVLAKRTVDAFAEMAVTVDDFPDDVELTDVLGRQQRCSITSATRSRMAAVNQCRNDPTGRG